jgi:hypothetical protein
MNDLIAANATEMATFLEMENFPKRIGTPARKMRATEMKLAINRNPANYYERRERVETLRKEQMLLTVSEFFEFPDREEIEDFNDDNFGDNYTTFEELGAWA